MFSYSEKIGEYGKKVRDFLAMLLGKARFSPNLLTLLGFIINIGAAFYFYRAAVDPSHQATHFYVAGWIIFVAGAMDMLDGAVARETNTASEFGAFFDSVIDRYSDIALYLGLIVYYGKMNRMSYVDLVGICIMGSVMTSYARARAESIIENCKVGFLERPERVVLLILGAWFNRMEHALWVIAVLSNWTVICRILYTYLELPKSKFLLTHKTDDRPNQ